MLHHGKHLKKILFERNISQKTFSIEMGYSEKNFTNNFYKEKLDAELIEKISDYLNIPVSSFDDEAEANTPSSSSEVKELYERLLAEKERVIQYMDKLNFIEKEIAVIKRRLGE